MPTAFSRFRVNCFAGGFRPCVYKAVTFYRTLIFFSEGSHKALHGKIVGSAEELVLSRHSVVMATVVTDTWPQ